jgi:hypothetical protein
MERPHQCDGVADAVEEIGIAKRDMLRARRHLAANILQHDVALHDAELPLVDRHNRTMPAQVLAAAAGFRIAHRAPRSAGKHELRVLRQRRQTAAVRHEEPLPGERDQGRRAGTHQRQ